MYQTPNSIDVGAGERGDPQFYSCVVALLDDTLHPQKGWATHASALRWSKNAPLYDSNCDTSEAMRQANSCCCCRHQTNRHGLRSPVRCCLPIDNTASHSTSHSIISSYHDHQLSIPYPLVNIFFVWRHNTWKWCSIWVSKEWIDIQA